jgi:phage N-6-adenine-methyltransferase
MNNDLMFSTGKDDWATPPEVFDPLHLEFGFTLDVAARADNAKCDFFYGPGSPLAEDALSLDWPTTDRIWCNPPYSRGLQPQFIARCARQGQRRGGLSVMLLPARTDTQTFHANIWDRERHKPRPWVREVRFLKGRVRFVGAPASAPFPSMIVVFGA